MERRLSLTPDLGFEDEPVIEVRVAVTTFAYQNSELIHLLRERGTMIKKEKWDAMYKLDKKINKLKKEHLEQFTTPCSIFMTMENEEGYNRALALTELARNDPAYSELNLWLNKYEIDIQPASEPTDIIWENRHFTQRTRLCKSIFVTIFLVFLLACSFLMILLCS